MTGFPSSNALAALLLALVCAGALPACSGSSGGPPPPDTGTSFCSVSTVERGLLDVELQHEGNARGYRLYVPETYDPRVGTPLVFNFHGTGGTPESMVALSGMNPAAETRGILIAYPQGLPANGLPVFDAGLRDFSAAPRDDVDFARAIADDVASRYCLDRRRVYSTGLSNGARMSYRIACEAADLVAAIAPVAGVLSLEPGECNPTRPVPALAFHGTADVVAPYDRAGGFSTRSVPSMFEVWAEKAECTGGTSLTQSSELVSCEAYEDCGGGADSILCTITDGGHCWPGGPGCGVANVAVPIDATEVMLDFFERFALRR